MNIHMRKAVAGALIAAGLSAAAPAAPASAATTGPMTAATGAKQAMVVPFLARRVLKEVIKAIINHYKRIAADRKEFSRYVNEALDQQWKELAGSDMRLLKYHAILIDDSLNFNADGLDCDDCDLDGNGTADANDDDGVDGPYVDIPDQDVADTQDATWNEDGTIVFTTTSGSTRRFRLLIAERGTLTVPNRWASDLPNRPPRTVPLGGWEFGVRTAGHWRRDESGSAGRFVFTFSPYTTNNPAYRGGGDDPAPNQPERQETPGHAKIVRLVNDLGWSVDVPGGQLKEGVRGVQAAKPQQGNRNQQWHLFDRGDGQYVIQTVLGGHMVLDVIPNNWNVQLFPAHYRGNQLWKFEPAGGGGYRIRAVYNMQNGYPHGGCLTADRGEGQGLAAVDCNRHGQLWRLLTP
ncbi:RICIN domain-containing protein [Nonomuraea pusilla]|uniref:RICIN domain-containing protein n=1 Tax=Nonomuraea pusilla TaxID=46177 RepID=UPI003331C261